MFNTQLLSESPFEAVKVVGDDLLLLDPLVEPPDKFRNLKQLEATFPIFS